MPEYAIACGCGRTMNPDGRAGRGAFRCGCGARIRIQEKSSPSSSCSATGCRTASVTGSVIRLCADHKDEVTMILAKDIGRTDLRQLGDLYANNAGRWRPRQIPVYEGPALAPTEAAVVREVPRSGSHDPIVYFMLNGERVKIGYTTHLAARITALSLRASNVILALDGGRELESLLHRRFHEYRIAGTEWFKFSDEIKQFVRTRRALPEQKSWPTCETP